MKKTLISTMALCLSLTAAAQPQGGFGGFQVPQVKLETSQEWKDVNYAGDDKVYHTCDIYLPKQQKEAYPVVIHIYGSAWFNNNGKGAADLGTIVKALLEAGYAVVCPNHRSSMDAKWPAQIHDIRAVIRFVRGEAKKYKFDTSFVATSGFSSGGHLASTAATTSGTKQTRVGSVDIDLEGSVGNYPQESSAVNAACDWSGPIDLTAMDCGESMKMGENSPEDVLLNSKLSKEPDKYLSLSATTYVDKNDPPVIIFHGEKDNVVPCCQGKQFFETLKAAGVKTEATFVPEGGHGMGMYGQENLQKMIDFLQDVRTAKTATLKKVYDEQINPLEQIDAAVAKAKAEGKFVVCQLGGNWCVWCLRFADYVANDSTISQVIADNYVYIHVNYRPRKSKDPAKAERDATMLKRLGNPGRFGYPVFIVLDEEGRVVHIQDSSLLEEGKSYNKDLVLKFFKAWTPNAVKTFRY